MSELEKFQQTIADLESGKVVSSVTKDKQQKIIKTAQMYAVKNDIYDSPMRFDAVLINADTDGEKLVNTKIEIIKDAFQL